MDFTAKSRINNGMLEKVEAYLRVDELFNDTFVLVAGEDSNSISAEPTWCQNSVVRCPAQATHHL